MQLRPRVVATGPSYGTISGVPTLRIAQDDAADELLSRDPLALLIGMLLDQQFPMERAFAGPRLLADRMGVQTLSAVQLAECDPEVLQRHFAGPPAVHRYPGSMAGRTQELARALVERYDGRADALWADVPDGATLLRRLRELPGFGAQKAAIFLALLGKQCGVTPPGWREAAGDYGQEGSRRSVADITDPASLAEVRSVKQAAKQAAKEARGAKASSD
ncbi:HhH-GPD-type base excision DNA repair protein [Modestobacter sp. VKM Ac-2982]|uniref:HhH-GPD-type base excision DNA repair protein n=1 Tax=Modestobacter sp. VKM Ac-2982 TaxID=3004136 RepID=UPI0022AB9360|nr:HhH-GPD-type base excision DNA repair protein [Modestobacter sp. VKM Ac-2982]MCZ2827201.1 Fe-S cluster assembly protein HesB [Modestobacter sp. VKM Ac-2981]